MERTLSTVSLLFAAFWLCGGDEDHVELLLVRVSGRRLKTE